MVDIMTALALQAWSIIFTFTANTAFYVETAEYLKTLDSSDLAVFNNVLFGMDWLQLCTNGTAIYFIFANQDIFVVLTWLANAALQGVVIFLGQWINDFLPPEHSEITLLQTASLNALAATVFATIKEFNPQRPYNLKIVLPAIATIVVGDIVGLVVYSVLRDDGTSRGGEIPAPPEPVPPSEPKEPAEPTEPTEPVVPTVPLVPTVPVVPIEDVNECELFTLTQTRTMGSHMYAIKEGELN